MRVAERKGKIRRQERGKRVKARYKVCERKQGDLEVRVRARAGARVQAVALMPVGCVQRR